MSAKKASSLPGRCKRNDVLPRQDILRFSRMLLSEGGGEVIKPLLLAILLALTACEAKEQKHHMKGVITEVGGCTRFGCSFMADFYGTSYPGRSYAHGIVVRGAPAYRNCYFENGIRYCGRADVHLYRGYEEEGK